MDLIPFFAAGTFFLLISSVVFLVILLLTLLLPKEKLLKKLTTNISKYAVPISFLVVASATLGSLFLSDIANFTPCKLCWWQRIFMYPQVIILGIGLILNDAKARIYAFVLSVIGFGIAIYHILIQFFPTMFQCSDEIANCALAQFTYFGFITIPVMSAAAFAFIIIILLFTFIRKK